MIFGDKSVAVLNDIDKIVMGKVNADGTIASSNIQDISCSRTSTGVYEISGTFPYDDYAVDLTVIGDDNNDPCMAYSDFNDTLTTGFVVKVKNVADGLTNKPFSFMINFFN